MKQLFLIFVFMFILFGSKAFAAEAVCSRGDILLCEDWEWSTSTSYVAPTPDYPLHGWEHDGYSQNFPGNSIYCNNVGSNSLCAYQIQYNPPNWGAVGFPEKVLSTACPIQQECYMRVQMKYSTNFLFNATTDYGVGKLFYFINGAHDVTVQIGENSRHTKWDTYNYLSTTCPLNSTGTVDNTKGKPAFDLRGTSLSAHALQVFEAFSYNEENSICISAGTSMGNVLQDPRPIHYFDRSGAWHTIEAMAKMNTAGVANGAIKMWFDGELIIDRTNFVLHSTPGTLTRFWIAPYMGCGVAPNCTQTQQMWFDNIVVSTHYIGPPGGTSITYAPAQVTGVTVTP